MNVGNKESMQLLNVWVVTEELNWSSRKVVTLTMLSPLLHNTVQTPTVWAHNPQWVMCKIPIYKQIPFFFFLIWKKQKPLYTLHTAEWGMILHSQTSISNLWIARLHSSHYTLMPIVCNNLILFQDNTLTALGKLFTPPPPPPPPPSV